MKLWVDKAQLHQVEEHVKGEGEETMNINNLFTMKFVKEKRNSEAVNVRWTGVEGYTWGDLFVLNMSET